MFSFVHPTEQAGQQIAQISPESIKFFLIRQPLYGKAHPVKTMGFLRQGPCGVVSKVFYTIHAPAHAHKPTGHFTL